MEEHLRDGANLAVDIPYHYLTFFLDDDVKLKEIETKYAAGEYTTHDVKLILIGILLTMTKNHQTRRSAITDEILLHFMTPRLME